MAALKLVWAERNLSFDISSQKRLKIGRGQNNDIILPDQLVSSQHAVVQGGFLEDLGSTNGTYVNGQLVEKRKKIKLKENDEVVLGDTLVRIVAAGGSGDTGSEGVQAAAQAAAAAAAQPDGAAAEEAAGGDEDMPALEGGDNPIGWHPGVARVPTARADANGLGAGAGEAGAAAAAAAGSPAGGGAASGDAELRSQVEMLQRKLRDALEREMQLKRTMNPRKAKLQQQELERKFNERIQDLEFQINYGQEQQRRNETDEIARLRTEIKELRERLAAAGASAGAASPVAAAAAAAAPLAADAPAVAALASELSTVKGAVAALEEATRGSQRAVSEQIANLHSELEFVTKHVQHFEGSVKSMLDKWGASLQERALASGGGGGEALTETVRRLERGVTETLKNQTQALSTTRGLAESLRRQVQVVIALFVALCAVCIYLLVSGSAAGAGVGAAAPF